jgi:hypothetical protein
MKNISARVGFFLVSMTIIFAAAFLVIGIPTLVVEHLFLNELMSAGLVSSGEALRNGAISLGFILSVLPMFVFGIQAFPHELQDELKVFGRDVFLLLRWVAYGALFCAGMYLFALWMN